MMQADLSPVLERFRVGRVLNRTTSVLSRNFLTFFIVTGVASIPLVVLKGFTDETNPGLTITLALVTSGHQAKFDHIPVWVIVSAGVAIGLGTYVGGWRIMRTLGQRLYNMEPAAGFAAQTTAGVTIYLATRWGYPLSTTHVISGGVLGAGATRRLSAVRWGVAGNIVFAWILTIPAAALVAAALYWPIEAIF